MGPTFFLARTRLDMIGDRGLLGSAGLQCEFIILLEIIDDGLGNAHELSQLVIVMGGTDVAHDLLSDCVAVSDPCG